MDITNLNIQIFRIVVDAAFPKVVEKLKTKQIRFENFEVHAESIYS